MIRRTNLSRYLVIAALAATPFSSLARAAAQTPGTPTAVAGREAADLALFERKAALSKELGATHMLLTEGLPLARWEMNPDDPYPQWFVHHASLLKIFPPAEVKPFINAAYVTDVQGVVKARCGVLAKVGLKAVWSANEPAVLPEAFFAAHPELRGPRIDQPNRSRTPYWAPNVDQPETLRLYREATQSLLTACPLVEQFNWLTTDAGSGFDWAASLYPGLNGNTNYRDRPMADRVAGFLINVQQAAHDAGHEIQINLNPIAARQWMLPTFPPDVLENTIRKLPRGLAVEGREGSDGRPFAGVAVLSAGSASAFYPVIGLSVPSLAGPGASTSASRFMVSLGDPAAIDANFGLLKFTRTAPMHTLAERMATLRAYAASEVGDAQADNLVEAWNALNDTQRFLQVLEFGDVLKMGDVLNRWITRPMVPFPDELTAADKKDYRPFLFQARSEEQADDLIDIQAMRMYEGWGGKMLFQRTIELALPRAHRALTLIQGIPRASNNPAAEARWGLTAKRLQAFTYLLESADNMVAYQAQLDRVKSLGIKPEQNPVLGVQSSWDRTDLMNSARKEIDTMVNLERLIESTKEPILDLAPTPEEETPMRLGPNIAAQIKHKIAIMDAHWRDYDRLFTVPNP